MEMQINAELPRETERITEITESAASAEAAAEQLEMNAFAEAGQAGAVEEEQREMDRVGKLGYSSDYYESEMARALENGNQIAYDNARRNWAKAKVDEST